MKTNKKINNAHDVFYNNNLYTLIQSYLPVPTVLTKHLYKDAKTLKQEFDAMDTYNNLDLLTLKLKSIFSLPDLKSLSLTYPLNLTEDKIIKLLNKTIKSSCKGIYIYIDRYVVNGPFQLSFGLLYQYTTTHPDLGYICNIKLVDSITILYSIMIVLNMFPHVKYIIINDTMDVISTNPNFRILFNDNVLNHLKIFFIRSKNTTERINDNDVNINKVVEILKYKEHKIYKHDYNNLYLNKFGFNIHIIEEIIKNKNVTRSIYPSLKKSFKMVLNQ